MPSITETIATELAARSSQVEAAIQLLDSGDTVPFISRYRKEATEGLDDTQLRKLEERLRYLRELADRSNTVLKEIEAQGKLTPELKSSITEASTKARLEDLYRPYKPKRRTRGQIAIEAGLKPLAETLFANPNQIPTTAAQDFINEEKGIADVKAALEGARYILMEQFAEEADLVGKLREAFWQHGVICSRIKPGQEQAGQKFSDYFEFSESINKIPSHRALAILRGRNESYLQVNLTSEYNFIDDLAAYFNISNQGRPGDQWLLEVAKWAWQVKLKVQLEVELITKIRENAETQAIGVFANNLKDLLMTSPAGMKATLGLDPGLRTGVKAAVVDETGKLVHHCAIYPHAPQNKWDQSIQVLSQICATFNVNLISIGNGTASRETDKLVTELLKKHPAINAQKVVVSEAGASVYSASELAANEFPKLDVSFRGAVSIARRLQDPLAELVKIDPKSIGVGQYQHDLVQGNLARSLETVVEDCVNKVGVDLNTSSPSLLSRVSGLNQALANNIVSYRDQHGAFNNRDVLKKVTRLGPKVFQQAAGFLRITNGTNPLDASGVHPESYPVVEKIIAKTTMPLQKLIGNKDVLSKLDPKAFTDDHFGIPTVSDVISELEKPGRDPRPEFKMASFKQGIEKLSDLKPGMVLEGSVTNVANFGAFVDLGVHQDGLVHISALASKFVKDPREIVKTGDIVRVKVLEIDIPRKRISLSMRLDDNPQTNQTKSVNKSTNKPKQVQKVAPSKKASSAFSTALMSALKDKYDLQQ